MHPQPSNRRRDKDDTASTSSDDNSSLYSRPIRGPEGKWGAINHHRVPPRTHTTYIPRTDYNPLWLGVVQVAQAQRGNEGWSFAESLLSTTAYMLLVSVEALVLYTITSGATIVYFVVPLFIPMHMPMYTPMYNVAYYEQMALVYS